MEIKILCSCGTKYQFEITPVDRRMPCTVQCPSCKADGTAAANQFLEQTLPAPAAAVAPPPPTAAPIRVAQHAAPAAPPPSPAGAPAASTFHPPAPPRRKGREYGEPNMLLGTTGAIAGGLLGMLIWFLIIKWTNSEWGIIAWGVGGLVGFGCRTLGQGYSRKLGIIAGACATIAILGGEYLGTKAAFDGFMDTFQSTLYEAQLAHARKAAKVSSDAEIRALLAGEEADQVAKEAITTAQIERFKKELPKLKDLASGKTTKEQFLKEIRDGVDESSEARGLVLKNSFSLWTLLWLFLGVGTAWRLGSGETE